MKWSLSILFFIVLIIILIFKNYDSFKGGRIRSFSGRSRGPFDIVDAVIIVLLLFYIFNNR